MIKGTIKFYHADKGYGFIAPDDGSRDLYFEQSQFKSTAHQITEGLRVSFKKTLTPKGPQATEIEVIS